MRNFQDTFETRKRSFISTFSICMTVPLIGQLGSSWPLVYPHKLLRISYQALAPIENSLRSERLYMNCHRLFQPAQSSKITIMLNLPKVSKLTIILDLFKVSKLTIIFDLLNVCKMTSLSIFMPSVMEGLRISNLRSRYTSLRGFHGVLHRRM